MWRAFDDQSPMQTHDNGTEDLNNGTEDVNNDVLEGECGAFLLGVKLDNHALDLVTPQQDVLLPVHEPTCMCA